MDYRTIIAFLLMVLIYFYFFQPKPGQVTQPTTNAIQVQSKATTSVKPPVLKPAAPKSELASRLFKFENNGLQIQFNGEGSIKDAVLLQYHEKPKTRKEAPNKNPQIHFDYDNQGFDKVLLTTSEGVPNWQIVQSEANHLQLESKTRDVFIRRSIDLTDNNYFLKFRDEILNSGGQVVKSDLRIATWNPAVVVPRTSFFSRIFSPAAEIYEVIYFLDGSINRKQFQSISSPIEKEGSISSFGFSRKYFFSGVSPIDASVEKIRITKNPDDSYSEEASFTEKQIAPKESSTYTYLFYFGPKNISDLEKASPELLKVIDYGSWLGPIARFLLSIMHLFYNIIPNYGIAIILLTLLVKAVLFPLAWKSAVSMRRLQMVQPKMKEIREKYKDDKNRMNAEMMTLYRTEKVNPVGGCLPMVLQMPIFFALYRVFYVSIELRHSPFVGWIRDLSTHDPYFVTPALMTALMWYQQKITPQPPSADDSDTAQAQRAMMKWMPIIFGGIMVFLPAGLTLYMLVNALISIVQQFYLNKHLHLKFPSEPKVAYKLKN